MGVELESVLGSFVSAVAQARRIADEETVAIAEYYRSQPLLAGMSVPRVRLPEVTVDLPVVVDEHAGGGPGTTATPNTVSLAARAAIKELVAQRGQRLPSGVLSGFQQRFAEEFDEPPDVRRARRAYADVADRTLTALLEDAEVGWQLDQGTAADLRRQVRRAVERTAVERAPLGPRTTVSVTAGEVGERDPVAVAHIRLRVREEGVEWTSVERPDGSLEDRLVPE